MEGIEFLLTCNYDTKSLSWIPTFYRKILEYIKETSTDYEGECIIWDNKYIQVGGKSIFWKEWYEKGIIYIHDFCNLNGEWMTFQEFCSKYNIRTIF